MDLIVKQASALSTEEKAALGITGIPSAWPIESYPYTDTVPVGFTQMTDVEMEEIKANNQAAYDAWVVSKTPIINMPPAVPTDTDGSPLSRLKIAPSGWTFQDHCFGFATSKLGSVYEKKSDGTDFNFVVMKFYEGSIGSETEITGDNLNQSYLDSNCTKTVVDFEPTHDYDVIGGEVRAVDSIAADLRVWVVAVPDVPADLGGNKELVTGGMNLKGRSEYELDGRVVKHLTYNATYHTNKIRMIFRHSAGVQFALEGCVDFYKA